MQVHVWLLCVFVNVYVCVFKHETDKIRKEIFSVSVKKEWNSYQIKASKEHFPLPYLVLYPFICNKFISRV